MFNHFYTFDDMEEATTTVEDSRVKMGAGKALSILLVPIILILLGSFVPLAVGGEGTLITIVKFIGNKNFAMLMGVLYAAFISRKYIEKKASDVMTEAADQVGLILLITGAGGAKTFYAKWRANSKPVVPPAVVVTVNDSTNKIVGADTTMEYFVGTATSEAIWISYDPTNEPVIDGNQTVKIRKKASGTNSAGKIKTITFTETVIPYTPSTPAASTEVEKIAVDVKLGEPEEIYLIGGKTAISDKVADELKKLLAMTEDEIRRDFNK
ncbi:MAG: DUF4073 domain-containing protein [Velocimicrobium sp.]